MNVRAPTIATGRPEPLGVISEAGGVNVAVVSRSAETIFFCLFDARGEREVARLALPTRVGDVHCGFIAGVKPGDRYGLRADGPYAPAEGHWFDPAKLLVDPYAGALDRPFTSSPDLAAPRDVAIDTAPLMPKAIVPAPLAAAGGIDRPPSRPPGFVYEVSVKAFSRLDPSIPEKLRGTVAALAEQKTIDYLLGLGVETVELMPLAAWIDERHLPPVGLHNAWGYNPVVFMAPDPRIAPGGLAEIAGAVAALHAAGINVILDAVFNHTGESDEQGPTLSLRGLDNALYYRLEDGDPGRFVNDTGTGNTLAVERPEVMRLVLDAMRRWARATGIDGFRLDLAAALGREGAHFMANCPLFMAIESDPLLGRLAMIAEPWDVGPGGYNLGGFPPRWLEWNDRYRDDVRRFWRGDPETIGPLATRVAGSADVFAHRVPSMSVNFLAAHDGFTLLDLVSYERKHNEANGEDNRDGNDANNSWNNGYEGPSRRLDVERPRRFDVRAMLATLFISRGTPMLTAGDEFGRTQRGNNNAYAQDNDITWLDWLSADVNLAAFVGDLARFRKAHPSLSADSFLTGMAAARSGIPDVMWLAPAGHEMTTADWTRPGSRVLGVSFYLPPAAGRRGDRTAIWINGGYVPSPAWLPAALPGNLWRLAFDTSQPALGLDDDTTDAAFDMVPPRSVVIFVEEDRSASEDRPSS